MTTDIKELVKRLREVFVEDRGHGHTTEWTRNLDGHEAADALEAMAGEVAWLKTQIAGLVDYETEIGEKLTAAVTERNRLQAENFRLRRALGVVAGGVLKPVLSDTHLQFNVLVSFARSALEAKP